MIQSRRDDPDVSGEPSQPGTSGNRICCGKRGITSDIEVIPIQKVNEAYERVQKSDVRYRFVIDMASLKDKR
jgi:hypothetical protein